MAKKKPNITGRPKIEFTATVWEQAQKMAHIQCTAEEIASVLGVSVDTLERRIKEKGYSGWLEWYRQHSDGGKMSLRRYQWELAKKSPAMAIWLGKQHLGQKDKPEIVFVNNYEKMTNEQLEAEIQRIEKGLKK